MKVTEEMHPTKKKLLEAGRKEFYEKGYLHASLRKICQAAGVTTGAFYFFFPSKEALFQAIVDPVIGKFQKLLKELAKREEQDAETALENDEKIMTFEWEHKKEVVLLMRKAEGSCREHFKEEIYELVESYFNQFFKKSMGHVPKQNIIKMLVHIRIQNNLEILEGNEDMKEMRLLTKAASCYMAGGFQKLIIEMNKEL